VEPERAWTLDALVAETRADVRHVQSDVTEIRTDVRRLDARIDQLFIVQLATLAAALGSLITALVNVLA
jgi:hypothetical protein